MDTSIERLRQIAACMDFLAEIRVSVNRRHPIAMVGELDTLSELHRLLHDEGHAERNRATNSY